MLNIKCSLYDHSQNSLQCQLQRALLDVTRQLHVCLVKRNYSAVIWLYQLKQICDFSECMFFHRPLSVWLIALHLLCFEVSISKFTDVFFLCPAFVGLCKSLTQSYSLSCFNTYVIVLIWLSSCKWYCFIISVALSVIWLLCFQLFGVDTEFAEAGFILLSGVSKRYL